MFLHLPYCIYTSYLLHFVGYSFITVYTHLSTAYARKFPNEHQGPYLLSLLQQFQVHILSGFWSWGFTICYSVLLFIFLVIISLSFSYCLFCMLRQSLSVSRYFV